ncbi:hypothetical protein HPG69_014671 [Diceros bicornis minor]|uniref:Uncharacterized protein n=1 Tax=Diceros bicornis minor TaxID=77932 RepID=A0A7J7EYV3_DICBM|nr:hypothetical protein HPG69_014671 [Diceros bicornis minor]
MQSLFFQVLSNLPVLPEFDIQKVFAPRQHCLPSSSRSSVPLVFLLQIRTGLRGYCKAPALSAILLSSKCQQWEDGRGMYSAIESAL